MLSLFQRKRPPVTAPSPAPATDLPKGLLRPESAASLLATPRRQKLLEHIWQRTPLERYAELVQQFPASESHHHAYPGGMLDQPPKVWRLPLGNALAAIPPCRLRPRPCLTSWRTCWRWLDWIARPTWGRVKIQWRKSLPQPQPQRLPCHLPLRLDLHQLQQSRYHPGSIS
ncbi:TraI domain-containing protein [Stutzerimonas stutzeri]|uniref:TraI domain-containing protein n=1 Tax=Stutzerimonas stutzeri TaxID=316 RepID=UPI003AFA3F7C